jgi:hypothetical protein
MAPQGGVALLAVRGPAMGAPMDGAVVEGLDGDGKTVASLPLKPSPPPEPDPACPKPPCPVGPPAGAFKVGPAPDEKVKPAEGQETKPPQAQATKVPEGAVMPAPGFGKVECHVAGAGKGVKPHPPANVPVPDQVPPGAPAQDLPAVVPAEPAPTTSTVAPDPAP